VCYLHHTQNHAQRFTEGILLMTPNLSCTNLHGISRQCSTYSVLRCTEAVAACSDAQKHVQRAQMHRSSCSVLRCTEARTACSDAQSELFTHRHTPAPTCPSSTVQHPPARQIQAVQRAQPALYVELAAHANSACSPSEASGNQNGPLPATKQEAVKACHVYTRRKADARLCVSVCVCV